MINFFRTVFTSIAVSPQVFLTLWQLAGTVKSSDQAPLALRASGFPEIALRQRKLRF